MDDSDESGEDAEGLGAGSVLGTYILRREIGLGGMGVVYEAVHAGLEKRVAIKTLSPHLGSGPVARKRFQREGRAAARLRHPNAVEVFDTGVHRGTPYLVMEYLEGEELGALLERAQPLSVERVADIMVPVAAAVSAAHALGIVHRDLKPANVFLAEVHQGIVQPKVLDFGLARLLDEENPLTRSAAVLGTPLYVSPEQALDAGRADALSDQYSLGVMLYECVTGRMPFEHETLFELLEAIIRGPFAPPRAHVPEIPEEFEAIILRAMQRAPADRFPSVDALARSLLPFASAGVRALWEPVFGQVRAFSAERLGPFRAPTPLSNLVTLAEGPTPVDAAAPAPAPPSEALTEPPPARSQPDAPQPLLPRSQPPRRPRWSSTLGDSVQTRDVRTSLALSSRAPWVGAFLGAFAFVALGIATTHHLAERVTPPARHAARAPDARPAPVPVVSAQSAPLLELPPLPPAPIALAAPIAHAAPTAHAAPPRRPAPRAPLRVAVMPAVSREGRARGAIILR